MRRWLFAVAAVALGLAVGETLLLAISALSPRARFYLSPPWDREIRLPDPDLGKRMSPLYPGNDEWGFRNPRVPGRTDILAIGDSMTYGFAAPAEKGWPRQLEPLVGKSVYAMAAGGYGPVEYRVLLDRGLPLNPHAVIVALYTGNDIIGAYGSVHEHGRGRQFGTQDPSTLEDLAEANRVVPFANPFERLDPASDPSVPPVHPVRRFISDHSKIYALVRGLAAAYSDQRAISLGETADEHSFEAAARQPGRYVFGVDPALQTVFLDAGAFAMSMDLDDVRIREGQRITEGVLRSVRSVLHDRGVRFLLAVVPTKERAYADLMARQPHVPEAYFDLLKTEQRLIDDLAAFAVQEGVEFVDTTGALRASLARGVRPYPPSSNTHPNARGYAAIAEGIAAAFNAQSR